MVVTMISGHTHEAAWADGTESGQAALGVRAGCASCERLQPTRPGVHLVRWQPSEARGDEVRPPLLEPVISCERAHVTQLPAANPGRRPARSAC